MKRKQNENSMKNLIPFKKGDPKCAELQKKGIETKRRKYQDKKDMKAAANKILTLALKRGDVKEIDDLMNLEEAQEANITVADAILTVMAKRALLGDPQAAIYIRDTAGQKPSDKVEVDQSLTIETWAKNHKVKL